MINYYIPAFGPSYICETWGVSIIINSKKNIEKCHELKNVTNS